MKRIKVKPGQVYTTRAKNTDTPFRRVISVGRDNSTRPTVTVSYDSGGNQRRFCQLRAFRLWAAKFDAKVRRGPRPRALVLR